MLLAERILGVQYTDMGRMYQLIARGRMSVFHTADDALSLVAQLDRAYMRLALAILGWACEVTDSRVNPHYKGLDKLFPHLGLKEVNTNGEYPLALVAGKLSGGGYGREAIAKIATTTKAAALYRGLDIIILTPATRKGQQAAQTHKSVLTLIHTLPHTEATTRWTSVPRQTISHRHGNTPAALPHHAEVLRSRPDSPPEVTLTLLQEPRSERVKQAQSDLDVDGVISAFQLRRYYGLEPGDLTGRLATVALMRPVKSRAALEVQQTLVVSDLDLAGRDDNELNHRLTLTEMRLSLGIPADRSIWQVDPRSVLKLNQPDARWLRSDGTRIAVEADTGQYAMRTVEQKLDSFTQQGYAQTLWGVASKTRGERIETRFGDADTTSRYKVTCIQATWWER